VGLFSTLILMVPGAVLYLLLFWLFSMERSEKDLLVSKLQRRYRPITAAGIAN